MKKSFIKIFPQITIIAVIIAFFLPGLIQNKIPFPADSLIGLYNPWRDNSYLGYSPEKFPVKNPLITDPVLQILPWRIISIDIIKNFNLPLWNPYSFSGQPLSANIQSAPFQVINIYFFLLPIPAAWGLMVITSVLIASLSLYVFLREIGVKRVASLYAALILPFSGFFIAWQSWQTIIYAAAFLPLALFCIHKLFSKYSTVFYLLLIFSLTQIISSGHAQTAVYDLLAVFLFVLYLFLSTKRLKTLLIILSAFIAAIMILFPYLANIWQFITFSNRGIDQTYIYGKQDWFIPPQHLIQLLVPDYFGNPTTANYWGIWNYGEFISFIGTMPLFFALIALVSNLKKPVFFYALLLISVTLALKNPISLFPYSQKIPIVSSFQPSRIIYLIDFSLICLSAYGFEIFLLKKISRKKIILLAGLYILIIFSIALIPKLIPNPFPVINGASTASIAFRNSALPVLMSLFLIPAFLLYYKKDHAKIVIVLLFILTSLELFRFGYKYISFSKAEIIYPRTKITDYLQSLDKPFRVVATNNQIANPNSLTAYKIESVAGYDPLYLKRYAIFSKSWQDNKYSDTNLSFNRFITPTNINSNLTNLMNVKYVLSFDQITMPGFQKILSDGKTVLYLNHNSKDRAFFVSEIQKKQTDEEIVNTLIENKKSEIAYSKNLNFRGGDSNGKISWKAYSSQSFTLETDVNTVTPLVISNINYPGWNAYIDGEKADIFEVNFLMQAILVPAGTHNIDFSYLPDYLQNSLILCLFGLLSVPLTVILWKKYQ